jgi:hydroxypyruvate reductase
VADASRFGDALDALGTFGGVDAYPAAVVARLTAGARGEIPETPKPSDPRLARSAAVVIGSRATAMEGACRAAERLGYRVVRFGDAVVGEARQAAHAHLRAIAAPLQAIDDPICIVSSGETTVSVTGSGRGGRNQEFALAAATAWPDHGRRLLVASAGTDGVDGPTDAAGACADETTVARARRLGLEPERFLQDNDSHTFFRSLGDLIVTGPTGTNVGDLQVCLAGARR